MDIISRIADFLLGSWQNIKDTFVFIGTPYDIASALVDIVLLSFVFYFILKLVRDSRAWQLLKGILLILAIGLVSNIAGLTALGFVISRTFSIFAIAFFVIFQPELRRALETVGRSGFRVISSDESVSEGKTHRLIESIVQACTDMAAKRCGALIVIERSTPLGDLADQENAVSLDAEVSTAFIKQLFYLGSPLHDGAVLIRNNRISAARVHIPLSDNYHLRRDLGTRHRAAIGASEIGDTISIVVSEERGTISICIDGRLFVLDNGDALRMQLHRLLLPDKNRGRKHLPMIYLQGSSKNSQQPRRQRVMLAAAASLLAFGFWLYVQITVNPIESKAFMVPLNYAQEAVLAEKNLSAQYRMETIRISLRGRKQTLDKLNYRNVEAFIDLAKVNESGTRNLPVDVKVKSHQYTELESVSPASVLISIRPGDNETSDPLQEAAGESTLP